MVSVHDAFSILKNSLPEYKEVQYTLLQARNHVLSQAINSPVNMPPFRQSAMDGFALCLHDTLEYDIIGEVKAGDTHFASGSGDKDIHGSCRSGFGSGGNPN